MKNLYTLNTSESTFLANHFKGLTKGDIRKTYRTLSMLYHPDKPKGDTRLYVLIKAYYENESNIRSLIRKVSPKPVVDDWPEYDDWSDDWSDEYSDEEDETDEEELFTDDESDEEELFTDDESDEEEPKGECMDRHCNNPATTTVKLNRFKMFGSCIHLCKRCSRKC